MRINNYCNAPNFIRLSYDTALFIKRVCKSQLTLGSFCDMTFSYVKSAFQAYRNPNQHNSQSSSSSAISYMQQKAQACYEAYQKKEPVKFKYATFVLSSFS